MVIIAPSYGMTIFSHYVLCSPHPLHACKTISKYSLLVSRTLFLPESNLPTGSQMPDYQMLNDMDDIAIGPSLKKYIVALSILLLYSFGFLNGNARQLNI